MSKRSRFFFWFSFLTALLAVGCIGWTPTPLQPGPQPPVPAQPGEEHTVINPTSGAALYAAVFYPADWDGERLLPALVLVPGGSGDSSGFLRRHGNAPSIVGALTQAGYAVIVFDPDGRGRSEGVEDYDGFVQQDGLAEVIRSAAAWPGIDPKNIGMITISYGITMGAGALARHAGPATGSEQTLPVRFLLDWEGPADRNDTGGCDSAGVGHLQEVASCDDEAFWSQREAAAFIGQIQVPYQRLQTETDHAQPDNTHAILMINNAIAGGVPWVRLNNLPPNQTYDFENPPPMLPDSMDAQIASLLVQYAGELFGLDVSAGTSSPSSPAVFFVVHIETSDHNTAPDSVGDEWPMLAALVELADRYGHKLTLEFQPQWAEYALAHPEALAQIRAWEAEGHEIAVHHHGVSHPAWDGYTNAPGYQNRKGYRGTMDEAMALLNQLPAEGVPRTGGMTDEETDWPATLIYATGEKGKSGGGMISTPTSQTYNGTQVTQVNNQGFALDNGPTARLEEIQAAVQTAAPGEVIGLVTHPYDFWNNQSKVEALFAWLAENGVQTMTVSTLLGSQ